MTFSDLAIARATAKRGSPL